MVTLSSRFAVRLLLTGGLVAGLAAPAMAQTPAAAAAAKAPRPADQGVEVPAEYVVGAGDVLGINFWRDPDMTGDVTVRPDGRITLPLLGDVDTSGLTPEELKLKITKLASKLIEDPTVTVIVRTINSRRVFISGAVRTPGAHPVNGPLTVMHLISLAGGLTEYADKKNITIIRAGQPPLKFNYNDVEKGKNLAQNILLKPGDQVVVPE